MAARHFAQSFEDESQDNEVAEALGAPSEVDAREWLDFRGRHLKQPEVVYVPTVPVSSLVVELPEDADADARARAHIDEIMRELGAAFDAERDARCKAEEVPTQESAAVQVVPAAEVEPETEPEPEPEVEPEPEPEAEPVPEPEAEPVPEPGPKDGPATDPADDLEAPKDAESSSKHDPGQKEPQLVQARSDAGFWFSESGSVREEDLPEEDGCTHTQESAAPQPSVPEFEAIDSLFDDLDEIPDFVDGGYLADVSPNPNVRPDGLEATAKLDREQVLSEARRRQDLREEQVAAAAHRERLEVSTNLSVSKSVPHTSSMIVPRKERLGFFAAIGERIARLFHMDER